MARRRPAVLTLLSVLAALTVAASARAQNVDLAVRYPAAIDWTPNCPPVEWESGPGDVWRLHSFTYRLGDKFRLECGPSTLVVGRSGTSVVLAALFPDVPGTIAAAPAAAGERVGSIWLRFNPARVGELFPPATVAGPGPASMLPRGLRLAAWKMDCVWMQDFLPSVPVMRSLTFDIDTPEGERRVYSVDTDLGDAVYEPFFKGRTLPPETPLPPGGGAAAFDAACAAVGAEYPALALLDREGWEAAKARHRPGAASASTAYEAAQVIADALRFFRDGGLRVEVGAEAPVQFTPARPLRASIARVRDTMVEERPLGAGVNLMRRADGIGMVLLTEANAPGTAEAFDAALDHLASTWGLIVDLRFCTAAEEGVAALIAGRFAERPVVYAMSRRRAGDAPAGLAEPRPRTLEPRGPWRFRGPVVVLTGRLTAGGAELLSLMLTASGAVSIGDRTAGVAAERISVDAGPAGAGIRVTIPSRLDLTPAGEPFWGVGIAPMVEVGGEPSYAQPAPSDEAYLAAVRRLHEVPEAERVPARP